MAASIKLKLVSPSSVGNYAACPMRLVWDSEMEAGFRGSGYADFGTLAHYLTMYKMGLNPPPPDHPDELEDRARSIYRSPGDFERDLDASTTRATKAIPTLPGGLTWVCERRVHNPKILPERTSRQGDKGFGGLIDILASDRSRMWDFKFVSRPPEKVKTVYLWQMASYHLCSGVPVCGLLFVTRDGRQVRHCRLDFRLKPAQEFAGFVSQFINSTGHADFKRNAYCMAGAHCEDFCEHRGRCYAYNIPPLEDSGIDDAVPSGSNMDRLLAMTAIAQVSEGPLF